MTIPFREFIDFDERSLRAEDPDSHNYINISDWDPTQYPNRRKLGEYGYPGGNHYEKENPVIRVKGGGQNLVPAGLEKMVNFELDVSFSQEAWVGAGLEAFYISGIDFIDTIGVANTENSTVNWANLSGRYKDKNGSVVWAGLVRGIGRMETVSGPIIDRLRLFPADSFVDFTYKNRSYAGGSLFPDYSDELTNIYGGLLIGAVAQYLVGVTWFSYTLQPNDEIWYIVTPKSMKIRYYNPITNAISKRIWSTAGGTSVILTGANFHISDADLNETAQPAVPWDFRVDEIQIIGLQGQGTTTLNLAFPADFTVDNEGQITISSTPALAPGTYELKLRNKDHTVWIALQAEGYAGDWRTDPTKRITSGERFVILVADTGGGDGVREDNPGGDVILTDWTWKDAEGNTISEHLAPIDTRARDVFYHGRILSQTNFSREVNDRTGMFSVGDMTFELANNDKRYSSLLANYFLKNQFVEIYHARKNHPEAWKKSLIKMIVDDYEIEGSVFRVSCKDVTNKYFQVTIPRNIINEDQYPNAHESVLGQPIPDILGLHTLGGKTPGAIEARLIDTAAFKYLAAAGSLHSVPQVYSEGVLQVEGAGNDYTISYEDGGRTYINFNGDQGEKKVTFDCTGYSHPPWNSVNGYVQNPAYVVLFVLAFLLETPVTKIDLVSFDDIAVVFGTLEVHTAGRWVGQDVVIGETVIQELLQTYGAKLFVDDEGKLKLDRKDVSNYTTDLFVFDQIHCLKPALRTFGLDEAINVVKAKYDFYPTASLFKSVIEARNETSIENFEAEREPSSEFTLKWTDSPVLAQLRTVEELVKFSEGYFKGEFLLPFEMIDDLDIMTNFRFQDPFGIAADGGGEFGRYFYVISLQPNHVDMTLSVIAVDLTWLISQESGSGSA